MPVRQFPQKPLLVKLAERQRYFNQWVEPEGKAGIEFGAFDRPMVDREKYPQTKYLDYFSRDELVEIANDNPNRNAMNIPEIDYVLKGRKISDVVDESVDYVVTVHVMEHLPDLVGWLNEVDKILKERGVIFSVIPNHTHIFDIDRPFTSVGEVVDNFELKRDKPPAHRLFDERYYRKQVLPRQLFEDYEGHRQQSARTCKVQTAYDAYKQAQTDYVDGHCGVFTPESFRDIIEATGELGLHRFAIKGIYINDVNPIEFLTALTLKSH